MLSNWVMPSLGPIQEPMQVYFSGHFLTPHANSTSEESTVSFSEGTAILHDAFSDYTNITNEMIVKMFWLPSFDKQSFIFLSNMWIQDICDACFACLTVKFTLNNQLVATWAHWKYVLLPTFLRNSNNVPIHTKHCSFQLKWTLEAVKLPQLLFLFTQNMICRSMVSINKA